jgi:hypothetical protein
MQTMIIKSLPKHTVNFRHLVEYVLTDGGKQSERTSFTFFHNLYGIDTESIARQFRENAEQIKHYAKVRGYHEIISWNPQDEKFLNEHVLRQFAQRYIELRGENGLCLAKPHFSTNHPHIHFIFSAMEFDGRKSMRADNEKFYGVRAEMEEFQKQHFPQMKSLVYQHFGKEVPLKRRNEKHPSENEMQLKKRVGENTKKQQLANRIMDVLNEADAFGEATKTLKSEGISIYSRAGMTVGVQVGKKSYRFQTLGVKHPMLDYLRKSEELARVHGSRRKTNSRER